MRREERMQEMKCAEDGANGSNPDGPAVLHHPSRTAEYRRDHALGASSRAVHSLKREAPLAVTRDTTFGARYPVPLDVRLWWRRTARDTGVA